MTSQTYAERARVLVARWLDVWMGDIPEVARKDLERRIADALRRAEQKKERGR